MKTLHTDREILRAIYNRYCDDFLSYERDERRRETKNYVPINVTEIAKALGMESEFVFGRLYYHLAPKHGRIQDGTAVPFFQKTFRNSVTGKPDLHVVNFPVLESVLASLEYEERKFRLPFTVSAASLAVAIAALLLTSMFGFSNRPVKDTQGQSAIQKSSSSQR